MPVFDPSDDSFRMSRRRRLVLLALVLATCLPAAGCSSRLGAFTGSLKDTGTESAANQTAPRGASLSEISDLARRYDAKPGDKRASLDYGNALRSNGQHAQAVAVLQRASIQNVGDRDIAAAYGKALADIGRYQEAISVLGNAHTDDRPNWRVLSVLGTIADQTGNHTRARELYGKALQIAPNEPSVLNNLGLSYIFTKDLAKAEEALRRAVSQPGADPRIQANLALALSLQGKRLEVPAPVAASGAAPAPARGGLLSRFAGSRPTGAPTPEATQN